MATYDILPTSENVRNDYELTPTPIRSRLSTGSRSSIDNVINNDFDSVVDLVDHHTHGALGLPTNGTKSLISASSASSAALKPAGEKTIRGCKTLSGRLQNSWWMEILASLISFFCMGAVVGVLVLHDGGPVPDWSFGITINAFLTVMTTIATTCLAIPLANGLSQLKWIHFYQRRAPILEMQSFDAASRGIWGSFMFLKAMLFDHFHGGMVAPIGLFAVIIAKLFGVFIQLAIRYPSMDIILQESNFIGVSNYYTHYEGEGFDKVVPYFPSSAMTAAFYNGFYSSANTDLTKLLSVSCATGNCEWDMFSTLAVCSRCTDLTDSIQDYQGGYILPDLATLIPSGLNSCIPVWQNLPVLNLTRGFQQSFFLANFTLLGARAIFHDDYCNSSLADPWALQCSLSLCAQDTSTQIVNGTITETVSGTFYNDSWVDYFFVGSPYDMVFRSSPPLSINSWAFAGLFYWVPLNTPAAVAFTNTGIEYTTGSNSDLYTGDYSCGNSDLIHTIYRVVNGSVEEAPGSTPNTYKEAEALFSRVAISMTNSLRSEPGNVMLQGNMTTSATFVVVRWPYLALPILVVVFTLLFLCAVMIANRGANATLWKSHSLAVLIVDHSETQLKGSSNVEVLEERLKDTRVRIEKTED